MKSNIKDSVVISLIGLFFAWSLIAGIERLIFFNADSYPEFLVKKTVTVDSKENIYELIQEFCPKGGTDVIKISNTRLVRCGLLWPTSSVMKVFIDNDLNANEENSTTNKEKD